MSSYESQQSIYTYLIFIYVAPVPEDKTAVSNGEGETTLDMCYENIPLQLIKMRGKREAWSVRRRETEREVS